MFELELGKAVDSMIKKLEERAVRPLRICWNGDLRSRLEISASQPLDQVSVGVIQSEFAIEPNCNNLHYDAQDEQSSFGPLGRLSVTGLNLGGRAYTLC